VVPPIIEDLNNAIFNQIDQSIAFKEQKGYGAAQTLDLNVILDSFKVILWGTSYLLKTLLTMPKTCRPRQ
jgi:hypothetical protein